MNKLFLTFVIFLISNIILTAQNRLHGTWESRDDQASVQMILDNKGFITFKADGRLLGGVGYNVDGEMLRMTYKTQKVSNQTKITITIRDLIKKEILKKDTGTIAFLDPNNIEICFKKTLQEDNTVSNDCRYFLKIK